MAIYGSNAVVSTTIAESPVDTFIYDTRTDSDGGAWRYKCQGTSWYNEGSGTYRGTRKEFPMVALIAAYTSPTNRVVIYDLDDPSTPVWMEFKALGGRDAMYGTGNPRCVAAANGAIVTGAAMTNYWPIVIDFIEDTIVGIRSAAGNGMSIQYGGVGGNTISQRNHTNSSSEVYWLTDVTKPTSWIRGGLNTSYIQDVAMYAPRNATPNPNRLNLPNPWIAFAGKNDGAGVGGNLDIVNPEGNVITIGLWSHTAYTNKHQVVAVEFDKQGGLMVYHCSEDNGTYAQVSYWPLDKIPGDNLTDEYMRIPGSFCLQWTGIVNYQQFDTGLYETPVDYGKWKQVSAGETIHAISAGDKWDYIALSAQYVKLIEKDFRNLQQNHYRSFAHISHISNSGYMPENNIITLAPTSVYTTVADIGPTGGTPTTTGTMTTGAVATGADLYYYQCGGNAANAIFSNSDSKYSMGTSDFYISLWVDGSSVGSDSTISYFGPTSAASVPEGWGIWGYGGLLKANIGSAYVELNLPDTWCHVVYAIVGGRIHMYLNGELWIINNSYIGTTIGSNTAHVHKVGVGYYTGNLTKFTMLKVGKGTITPERARKWYQLEKPMLQPNAKILLNGSGQPTGVSYDSASGLVHFVNTTGRSTFSDFIRVDTTTTPYTKVKAGAGFVTEF